MGMAPTQNNDVHATPFTAMTPLQLQSLSPSELKALAAKHGVDVSQCCEKVCPAGPEDDAAEGEGTETQRGRLWTACGQRRVDSKNSQTTPATTSTSSIRHLLGAADA